MKSERKKIIDKTKELIREILKIERGNRCEFCGRTQAQLRFGLSLFHILPVSSHPRLELTKENLMLACFAPFYYGKMCHNLWENRDPIVRPRMELKIKELYGEDYEEKLLFTERSNPPLNTFRANEFFLYYKQALEQLTKRL